LAGIPVRFHENTSWWLDENLSVFLLGASPLDMGNISCTVHTHSEDRATLESAPSAVARADGILIDGGAFGEIRSEAGKRWIFHKHDHGFATLGSCEEGQSAIFGSEEPTRNHSVTPRPPRWRDRRIIPGV
jgi:hypothetical protein